MPLKKNTITDIIKYCNRDLVPNQEFNASTEYHSDWFVDYFSFLDNKTLSQHLGDAYYQARFMYKLMSALSLPLAKQKGIVKFQIVQYASICEAVLDTAITRYFKTEAEEKFSFTELVPYQNALSAYTKISHLGTNLILCKEKKVKGTIKRTRIDFKTGFAVEKGLIDSAIKASIDKLYDLRNNIHILKAVNNKYNPKLHEAKDAFLLMNTFVDKIKQYYIQHPLSEETIFDKTKSIS